MTFLQPTQILELSNSFYQLLLLILVFLWSLQNDFIMNLHYLRKTKFLRQFLTFLQLYHRQRHNISSSSLNRSINCLPPQMILLPFPLELLIKKKNNEIFHRRNSLIYTVLPRKLVGGVTSRKISQFVLITKVISRISLTWKNWLYFCCCLSTFIQLYMTNSRCSKSRTLPFLLKPLVTLWIHFSFPFGRNDIHPTPAS